MVLCGAPGKLYKGQLKRRLAQAGINHQTRQQEASDRDSWRSLERKAVTSRQRGMKPQRKNAGGRKSEQHLYHSHPKPSSVQSAVECAHQESVSTATNERARFDHQPSQQSSSARNEPSLSHEECKLLQGFAPLGAYVSACVCEREKVCVCLSVCLSVCLFV